VTHYYREITALKSPPDAAFIAPEKSDMGKTFALMAIFLSFTRAATVVEAEAMRMN